MTAMTQPEPARDAAPSGNGAEADIHLEGVTQALRRHDSRSTTSRCRSSAARFFAMLGPSGCGKTTTLRMIGGFEDPTEGRVFLGGDDVTEHPPYKRDVNTVFQSYALFPHLSVEKNVALRPRAQEGRQGRGRARASARRSSSSSSATSAKRKPGAALRRPAAARRARPRARQPPARAAARRAARRARPAPAQAAADRAQAHPAGRRHHVRARDARPGGGHDAWPTRSR